MSEEMWREEGGDSMSLRDQILNANDRAAHAETWLIILLSVADDMADALERAGDTFTRLADTAEAARCYEARGAYTEAKAAPN